jgi:hypothetical protein
VLEAGPEFFNRRFGYEKVETTNLRTYQAPLVFAPSLHAEVYPLALMGSGAASGVGLEAGYTFSVGLKSRRPDGVTFPSAMNRLDFGPKYRYRATESFTLIPALGYRQASFAVSPAADGSTLDGLPGLAFSSIRAGLGAEFAFGKMVVLGGFSYLAMLSAGDIVGPNFFSSGSGSGVEGQLGLGYKILSNVELRLAAQLNRYALTFKPAETDTFIAAGAYDQYLRFYS